MAAGGTAPSRPQGNRPPLKVLLIGTAAGLLVLALVLVVVITEILPRTRSAGPAPVPSTVTRPPLPATPAPTAPSSPADSPTGTPSAETAAPVPDPEPMPDYPKVADEVGSGVLKVYASGCGTVGSRIGSAFLIDERTALASWSSLAGAQVVAVAAGGTTTPALVSAADPASGIAVLTLGRPVDGHVFDLDDSGFADGDPVGLVGVPADRPGAGLVTGTVTGVDEQTRLGSYAISGLASADVGEDFGFAGAPTLAADGRANGMVLTGPDVNQTMIISGGALTEAVDGAGDPGGSGCRYPTGPNLTMISGDTGNAAGELLSGYFEAINTADYDTAHDLVVHEEDRDPSYEEKAAGWQSSYDYDIRVHRVIGSGADSRAHVSFTSIFLRGTGPEPDLSCAHWNLDYSFARDDGQLKIDQVSAHGGGDLWKPC